MSIVTTRRVVLGALMLVLAWAGSPPGAALVAQGPQSRSLPTFEVDPAWPKVPEKWKLGDPSSFAIDAQDNVWLLHRPRTLPPEQASTAAPPVMVFDPSGKFIKAWGGAGNGYEWPEREHGIHVDAKGFVWLGGNNCPTNGIRGLKPVADDQLLKFTSDGKLVMQVGKSNQSKGNADTRNLHRPADAWVNAATNEVFVADGYGNHRVVVLDATTGAYKRHWGAYGAPPEDTNPGNYDPSAPPAKQFRAVTCVSIAKDGTVYVCDRTSDRIQSFKKDGTFIKEAIVAKETLANGSVWDIALSSDPQQRYMFVADGQSHRIIILQRDTMEMVGTLGVGGRIPGRFNAPSSVAVDSRGNLYTGETFEGKRVQKFTVKR